MQIQQISAYPLAIPLTRPLAITYTSNTACRAVIIKLSTDNGYSGYGEAAPFSPVTGETPQTVLAVLDRFKPLLLGKNPLEIRTLINTIDQAIAHNSAVKAGIDIALHDLAAQYYRVPLKTLLGGQCRDRVVTSLTAWIGTIDETIERVRYLLHQGAKIIKLKVGRDLSEDIARIKALRETFGYDFLLRVDANQGYTPKQAVKFLENAATYQLELLEQPTPFWDLTGLTYVTRHSPIPIMADETVHTPTDVIRLIKDHACDLINIKLMKAGGILRAQEVATIAQAGGIGCMLGAMVETKIGMTAATHLAYSHPNIRYADLDGHIDLVEDPIIGGLETKDGCNYISDSPGLGVALETQLLQKFSIFS